MTDQAVRRYDDDLRMSVQDLIETVKTLGPVLVRSRDRFSTQRLFREISDDFPVFKKRHQKLREMRSHEHILFDNDGHAVSPGDRIGDLKRFLNERGIRAKIVTAGDLLQSL